MKGRFPHHEHQGSAFFKGHVGGSSEQVRAVGVGYGREGTNGARRDEHSRSRKRSAGRASGDISNGVNNISQRLDLVNGPTRLESYGYPGCRRDYKVGYDVGLGS